MSYPAALGQRPLDLQEAYAALQQYAADYGREPLLLLMHAAVPETLRPDLLALIRQNFRPRSRNDASLDADVLFAPLTTALGGGYYRIDAQVRWHALGLLRSRYRDDPRQRTRRIAELLWRYVEATEQRARRAADPLLAGFLDVQRWVALSFLEPASAAQAFADALRQTGDAVAAGTVALRLGGLSSAIELPLGHRPELLAYARGLDALVDGDEPRARELLASLGDEEMHVGEVVLEAPAALLQRHFGAALEGEGKAESSGAATMAKHRTCLLILAAGSEPSDRDALRELVRAVLDEHGIALVASDHLDGPGELYRRMLSVDVVLCDIGELEAQAVLHCGIVLALRRGGMLVFQRRPMRRSSVLANPRIAASYDAKDLAAGKDSSFAGTLRDLLADTESPVWASAVYQALPRLVPPRLGTTAQPLPEPDRARPGTCLVLMDFARPTSAPVYESIRRVALAAGLTTVRPDRDDPAGLFRGLLDLFVDAGAVILDLTHPGTEVLLNLGVCLGLQDRGTLIVSAEAESIPFDLRSERFIIYRAPESDTQFTGSRAFESSLAAWLRSAARRTAISSPVYRALPGLRPPTRAPKRHRVFLSYVREYLPLARALAEALAPDVDVDWDMTLAAGEVWQQRLGAMLEGADAVIAIAGRQTLDRPYPIAEMHRAIELGKRLIPVFVDAFEAPSELSGRMGANVDPDGRLLYLGDLEGEALQKAIAMTAQNVLRALATPAEPAAQAEANAPRRYPLVVYTPAQLQTSDGPPDLGAFAWRFLATGGSWFSVGTLDLAKNSNLLAQMVFGRPACAVNCAAPGERLSRVNSLASGTEVAALLSGRLARPWDALLLSFGGDDLFEGVNPPYRTSDGRMVGPGQRLLLTSEEWAAPEAGAARYISSEGWAAFERYLLANLERLVALRDDGPSKGVPIFLHGYPVPTPRPAGAGLNIGPWLLPAFERCGIPSVDHIALAAALVERLNGGLQRAADDVKVFRNLHFFDAANAGLVPASPSDDGASGDWATEIHPTRSGYAKLAAAWCAQIEAVLGAAR